MDKDRIEELFNRPITVSMFRSLQLVAHKHDVLDAKGSFNNGVDSINVYATEYDRPDCIKIDPNTRFRSEFLGSLHSAKLIDRDGQEDMHIELIIVSMFGPYQHHYKSVLSDSDKQETHEWVKMKFVELMILAGL